MEVRYSISIFAQCARNYRWTHATLSMDDVISMQIGAADFLHFDQPRHHPTLNRCTKDRATAITSHVRLALSLTLSLFLPTMSSNNYEVNTSQASNALLRSQILT